MAANETEMIGERARERERNVSRDVKIATSGT